MPAATNKTDLLTVCAKEYAKLEAFLAKIASKDALKKDEETSIKDVIAHRAHWIDLFLGWYADGQAGKEVHFPAKGYKWNELKRYNSELRERQKDLSWDDACTALHGAHQRLIAFLQEASNETLYEGPMKGANNAWTTGRWAEAAGPSHYRSAAKYIRKRVRDMKG